jgi:hypothetical protein
MNYPGCTVVPSAWMCPLSDMARVVHQGVDPTAYALMVDGTCMPPCAAKALHWDRKRVLLELGADVHRPVVLPDGCTVPAMWVCPEDHIKPLAKWGADPNACAVLLDCTRIPPCGDSTITWERKVQLLGLGADVRRPVVHPDGSTRPAIWVCPADEVPLMVELGADVRDCAVTSDGVRVPPAATNSLPLERILQLLDMGADVNAPTVSVEGHTTPVLWLCPEEHVEALVSRGAHPGAFAQAADGTRVPPCAALHLPWTRKLLLLKMGADIHCPVVNADGSTMSALASCPPDHVQPLLQCGAIYS